ncbi:MAG: hypothetical protein OXD50_05315 [Chloroflexi bacterium]|nr:hypothetical protein [Chloroflexota bacterium]
MKPDAFRLRPGEDHLSLHWLEFFAATAQADAVAQVRESMTESGFALRQNGRFAVLRVGEAKAVAKNMLGLDLRFEHMPLDNDPAHSGMFLSQVKELAIATELAFLVTNDNTYPAIG